MTVRIYIAPRVNDGRIHNVLRDIVPRLAFEEIRNDSRMQGICIVDTDDATHAILAGDNRVAQLPIDLPATLPQLIKNRIEQRLNITLPGTVVTVMDAVRYIAAVYAPNATRLGDLHF